MVFVTEIDDVSLSFHAVRYALGGDCNFEPFIQTSYIRGVISKSLTQSILWQRTDARTEKFFGVESVSIRMTGPTYNEVSLEPEETDDTLIKSDETLFSIIETVQRNAPCTLTHIANNTDMAKSAVYKHLMTLKRHGFVTTEDGKYKIGLRFLEIGIRAQESRMLYQITEPKLEEVALDTNKLVWCITEENGLCVFLHGAEGGHSVSTDAVLGTRMHMHYLSGGKAMLAYMDEESVREIIQQYGLPRKTEHTITEESELFEELQETKERGFALEFEESLLGLNSVAAPILSDTGHPLGAIMISGAAHRMTHNACRNEFAEAALAVANEIELEIQYS